MENKYVGGIIIGVSLVMSFMIILFNTALRDIINATCSHGPECSMYSTLGFYNWFSIILVAIIFVIGLSIFFRKPKERIVLKKIKEKRKKLNMEGLDKDERKVITLLQNEGGAIFQKTLMEKLEIGKVKTTRLLDKLEAKQFIERKRRGMNNMVVLKRD